MLFHIKLAILYSLFITIHSKNMNMIDSVIERDHAHSEKRILPYLHSTAIEDLSFQILNKKRNSLQAVLNDIPGKDDCVSIHDKYSSTTDENGYGHGFQYDTWFHACSVNFDCDDKGDCLQHGLKYYDIKGIAHHVNNHSPFEFNICHQDKPLFYDISRGTFSVVSDKKTHHIPMKAYAYNRKNTKEINILIKTDIEYDDEMYMTASRTNNFHKYFRLNLFEYVDKQSPALEQIFQARSYHSGISSSRSFLWDNIGWAKAKINLIYKILW